MGYVGFYGPTLPFSNMHQSPFVIDSVEYSCVEQYMQAQKAMVFGDDNCYFAIMLEKNPKAMKRFGRSVAPFIKDKWDGMAEDIIKYRGHRISLRGCVDCVAL